MHTSIAEEQPRGGVVNVMTLQDSHAAMVVSPCKSQLAKVAHRRASAAAAAHPSDVQNQQSRPSNEPLSESDDNNYDILELVGGMGSMDSETGDANANGDECVTPVGAASRRASRELAAINHGNPAACGRSSAISTSLVFQHSPEMMMLPEPESIGPQQVNTDNNPLTIQPSPGLLEFDYYNMDIFGEKGSFDSSAIIEQGTPLKRRHSLDLTSPHEPNPNPNHNKHFKHSVSLPHEYGHLNAPLNSFGSNTSDLTPIPIGEMMPTPKIQNEATPIKPRSSPMPLALPPKIDVTNLFGASSNVTTRVFLSPKATRNGILPSENHSSKRQRNFSSTVTYSNAKRSKLNLPPRLVPEESVGRRLVVVRGSSKQCTDTRLDVVATRSIKKQENPGLASKINPSLPHSIASSNAHFSFLKSLYPALEGCTFLLPGLKTRLFQKKPFNIPGMNIRVSSFGSFKLGHDGCPDENGPTAPDLAIAKRRIESAICAFGGTVKRKPTSTSAKPDTSSIFRISSADKPRKKNDRKSSPIKKSTRKIKNQYYDNGKTLSWEVESNISFDKADTTAEENVQQKDSSRKLKKASSTLSQASSMDQSESSKRYKCKLCGQVKQNHLCPFRQTMLRSIGVMAFPSANAYAANEPGKLAPSLCEMNNFVLLGSQSFDITQSFSFETSAKMKISQNALTSAFERRGIVVEDASPVRKARKTMVCKYRQSEPNVAPDRPVDEEKKSEENESELLFQPTMEITQEQYRFVTATPVRPSKRAPYSYPPVPMSYSQRESMSDKLFKLSKNIHGLAKECKAVLNDVSNDGDWDLAVAELMAQVVCMVCCSHTNDFRLDGLSSYLLQLGISC